MNPGNGIETRAGNLPKHDVARSFHINESRQRDWNKIDDHNIDAKRQLSH